MQVLIAACNYMVQQIAIEQNLPLKLHADTVRNFDCADDDAEVPENVYNAVMACWNSDQIQAAWMRRDEFWCLDSIE
ncbi:hypothetical protein SARC_07377 [Sphaeroforma arctica JP610]|uniref:Uncharacterized protein n=1 Tax=Sphaeroforma arctica JP610 TaxID=667725 RepID=A0A0L0FTW8_9EUKA|nr:hypothetical protein SARC_07377 [Sphaeroforma arctica JP610]KNC80267.1 hypothetical protein SARC_07377 [Sphaeroforma arctica JP610]|eukprot:XP_014154169.1 hypothetical protein SARC_07377 [Sphaeroforma arctica JP610]